MSEKHFGFSQSTEGKQKHDEMVQRVLGEGARKEDFLPKNNPEHIREKGMEPGEKEKIEQLKKEFRGPDLPFRARKVFDIDLDRRMREGVKVMEKEARENIDAKREQTTSRKGFLAGIRKIAKWFSLGAGVVGVGVLVDKGLDREQALHDEYLNNQIRPMAEKVEGVTMANRNLEQVRKEIKEIEANSRLSGDEKASLLAVKRMEVKQLEAEVDSYSQE